MFKIDIVVVSFNSSKWIEGFFGSLRGATKDLKEVSLIVIDNNSSDDTVIKLNDQKRLFNDVLGSFEIIDSKSNEGFGRANNRASELAKSEYLFFLNIDTELYEGALTTILKTIEESDDCYKVWEMRQFPYEHPKIYNPLTGDTPWASGAALIIDKAVFDKIGKFDSRIFMYAEDVDISWRVLLEGYKIKYVPEARVIHHAYKEKGEIKPTQYYYGILNHLYLRCKYGSVLEVIYGAVLFLKAVKSNPPFPKGRLRLIELALFNIPRFIISFFWRAWNQRKIRKVKDEFYGIQLKDWDYSLRRKGDFYENKAIKSPPLVSIIMRSYNRSPKIIAEALSSIDNQTYSNIEVILVEDGTSCAEKLIENHFDELHIEYVPLPENKGRSHAGNIGMTKARGKYIGFLDDDDLLYADHIEILVGELENSLESRVAYARAFASPISFVNSNQDNYKEHGLYIEYDREFNLLMLLHGNYLPIQSVLFEKALFDEEGGFDVSIDYHEDWDLWLRYALKTRFISVDKVTSVYRIPYKKGLRNERNRQLESTKSYLESKHEHLRVEMSVGTANIEMREMISLQQPFIMKKWWYRAIRKLFR